jgi:hypothetical protein
VTRIKAQGDREQVRGRGESRLLRREWDGVGVGNIDRVGWWWRWRKEKEKENRGVQVGRERDAEPPS